MIASWPCPLPAGGMAEELLLRIGEAAAPNTLLIIPPLFDEHNKLRRQLVKVMRELGDMNVACILPDLPGLNESLYPLEKVRLSDWRAAVGEAIERLGASHVLAVRSGALIVPDDTRGWFYAPQEGAKLLRAMIRARIVASKEAGMPETSDALVQMAHEGGITLNGWKISAGLYSDLEQAAPAENENLVVIDQSLVGGAGLWLRAEPDEDDEQAANLATAILEDLGKPE